jgi:hypothetical protein
MILVRFDAMSNKDRYDLQMEGLLDEIDRSIIEASDEEVSEEAKVAGVDLRANADDLKGRFAAAARTFKKRKFAVAQKEYDRRLEDLQAKPFQIPVSATEQRALLQLVIAQQVQSGASLTAKFRDFESLPDSDLLALLEELASLGLLPKQDEKG